MDKYRKIMNDNSSDDLDVSSADESNSIPQTYIVIKFASKVKCKTIAWLVDKIRGQQRDGGAELIVRRQECKKKEGLTLHISASKIKFLELAEQSELTKRDKYGQVREFAVSQLEDFLIDGMHVDDLLTAAECQTMVKHELENIRALLEDDHIPGYPNLNMYEGQSIIQVLQKKGLIDSIFPLHNREELHKLGKRWYLSFFQKQPFDEIRLYFGEAIALYFTFLGFYTTALLVPMVLGFVQLFVSSETVAFFCIFNVIWVTVFLETWKRRSSELAYSWGTIGMTSLDEPRPNFHGHMGIDAVTGKIQPQFPRWKTNLRMYCVSLPIVFVCMVLAFFVMLLSFWFEDKVRVMVADSTDYLVHLVFVPSIVYAALVYIMNMFYRKLATSLTEWENHRTQSQYDRHRVTKLVLFEFVNNFMSFFYIAFVKHDMDMLRTQLATMLIILQLINNFQEAILPLLIRFYARQMKRFKIYISSKAHKSSPKHRKPSVNFDSKADSELSNLIENIPVIPYEDPIVQATVEEGNMENYEGTYDDYLEMFIQFGYVVLFSSVYPIAAFWAVANNILEIRGDAFKLCKVYQRPMTKRVKDTGAWQKAFEALGTMSIMTNCGLLCISPQLRRRAPDISSGQWILLFVILEHALLFLRYILNQIIPDRPEWVRVALARKNFESKQALKHEKAQKSRRILERRFKTVHGPHKHKVRNEI